MIHETVRLLTLRTIFQTGKTQKEMYKEQQVHMRVPTARHHAEFLYYNPIQESHVRQVPMEPSVPADDVRRGSTECTTPSSVGRFALAGNATKIRVAAQRSTAQHIRRSGQGNVGIINA